MIIFEKVVIKNLFSFGNVPTEIPLNTAKTTLVIGKNGSGKSAAIIDSIHLALFNKPFRDIPKPICINSVNGGGTIVELYFSKGANSYKVVRGLKPNKFEIYENNKLLNQEASARDDQAYLENTILDGMNDKVFKQVVMIGSANYVPFMQLSTPHRREVIEELLDIKIFSSINSLVKDKLGWYKETLQNIENEISIIQQRITINKTNQSHIQADTDKQRTELEDKIKQHQTVIDTSTSEIALLGTQLEAIVIEDIQLIQSAKQKAETTLWKLQEKQKENQEKIQFFETTCNCSTCLQNITEEHKALILAPLKEKEPKFTEAIDQLNESIVDYKKQIADITEATNKKHAIEKKISDHRSNISMAERYITDCNSRIDNLSQNDMLTRVNQDLDTDQKLLDAQKEKRIKETENKKYYDVISSLLKDGGIKTKIIKQYLPVMNKVINEYLVRFGTPIEFTLDEQFNEVIKSRYRDVFKYNSFSEGEKQRIDMALLLAWRQIARSKNTTNTNLLIMDETFDSSLDVHATEELLNILSNMDKNTNIFIISHKNDLEDKVSHVLEFVKRGNFSQIA